MRYFVSYNDLHQCNFQYSSNAVLTNFSKHLDGKIASILNEDGSFYQGSPITEGMYEGQIKFVTYSEPFPLWTIDTLKMLTEDIRENPFCDINSMEIFLTRTIRLIPTKKDVELMHYLMDQGFNLHGFLECYFESGADRFMFKNFKIKDVKFLDDLFYGGL